MRQEITNGSTSTITFNLATRRAAWHRLYIALASIIRVRSTRKSTASTSPAATGYFPAYSNSSDESDASIREGIHGTFSDNPSTFAAACCTRAEHHHPQYAQRRYFANHAMYDTSGWNWPATPPAPANLTALRSNNCNLVCWAVTPGATSYNIFTHDDFWRQLCFRDQRLNWPHMRQRINNTTYLDLPRGERHDLFIRGAIGQSRGSSTNSLESQA